MLIPVREKFLASDEEIAINSTEVDGSDFTSKEFDLSRAEFASITCYVKGGHGSVSQDVIFKFVTYDSERDQWDTEAYVTINVTPSGTSVVQKTTSITPDVEKIKLYSIQNQETTAGYTVDANASLFRKER